MELHGTIAANLRAAVASASRLQGQRVYKETLAFWGDLVDEARRARNRDAAADGAEVNRLISTLEAELVDRQRPSRSMGGAGSRADDVFSSQSSPGGDTHSQLGGFCYTSVPKGQEAGRR